MDKIQDVYKYNSIEICCHSNYLYIYIQEYFCDIDEIQDINTLYIQKYWVAGNIVNIAD